MLWILHLDCLKRPFRLSLERTARQRRRQSSRAPRPVKSAGEGCRNGNTICAFCDGKCACPAARRHCRPEERAERVFFRDAPGLAPGTPLICAESRKSGDVDGQQIQCRQIVQDFHEAAFSFEGYAFFPSYEERNAKARSFFARCLVKSTKAGYNVSIF